MENSATIIIGLNNITNAIKNIFYYSKTAFRLNLTSSLVIYYSIGGYIFIFNKDFNIHNYTIGWVFNVLYFGGGFLLFNMIMVEFNFWKKKDLTSSDFLKFSQVIRRWTEIKYQKSNKITTTKTTVNIKFLKKVNDGLIKVNNKVEEVEKKLKKKENLKILNGFSKSSFEVILNSYRKDLFPSININHFSDFAFTEKNEKFNGNINKTELKKFLKFMRIFQTKLVIGSNQALLSRIIKNYFQPPETKDTIYRWLNKDENNLINDKILKQIESHIRKNKQKRL